MTQFVLVTSSREVVLPIRADRQEYAGGVREMKRAFESLRAIFTDVNYDISCGVPNDGRNAGHRLVEGTVLLNWGQDVPSNFKIRTFLDAEGEQTPFINGLRQAMGQVFSVCVQRAEGSETDLLRRFVAAIIELGTLFDRLRTGQHLEFMLEPVVSGAKMHVMAWVDGEQHEQLLDYGNTEIQRMRESLLAWIGGRIGTMLDEEYSKRLPANNPVPEVNEAPPRDEAPAEPVSAGAIPSVEPLGRD